MNGGFGKIGIDLTVTFHTVVVPAAKGAGTRIVACHGLSGHQPRRRSNSGPGTFYRSEIGERAVGGIPQIRPPSKLYSKREERMPRDVTV